MLQGGPSQHNVMGIYHVTLTCQGVIYTHNQILKQSPSVWAFQCKTLNVTGECVLLSKV